MTGRVVDCFAGPGGWDRAAESLGTVRCWYYTDDACWIVEVPWTGRGTLTDLGEYATLYDALGAVEKWAADRHLHLTELDDFAEWKTWRVTREAVVS